MRLPFARRPKEKVKNLSMEELKGISLAALNEHDAQYRAFIEHKALKITRQIARGKFHTDAKGFLWIITYRLDYNDADAVCDRLRDMGFQKAYQEPCMDMRDLFGARWIKVMP